LKQIVVLSGKGGTGKTTITASLAALSREAVLADCDVDASNLHLLLKPSVKETIEFKGLKLAVINPEICIQCGVCQELCRFDAIKDYTVDPVHCEGCKVCVVNCPVQAIEFVDRICGYAYLSETKYGPMSHARLTPGMENSGKLVTLVRQNAVNLAEAYDRDLVLVDGSPGIGCPVIASVSNVDASLLVIEPTLSGIHDLERIIQLLDFFDVKPMVCVNKYDLNTDNAESIQNFCKEQSIDFIGLIPNDRTVYESNVKGVPVTEYDPNCKASSAIIGLWRQVKSFLEI
jgi:MinD superfamily P-loop ATPase